MADAPVAASRLVVTGDVLRPSPDGPWSEQDININWLHAVLDWPLRAATGLSPETLLWSPGGFDTDRFYQHFGLTPSVASWARVFHAQSCPAPAESQILEHLSASVVIAFELNPLIASVLDRHNIPYLNLMIHPVRFLDDIFFGVTTNVPTVYRALLDKRTPEAAFHAAAGVLRAARQRDRRPGLADGTVLIAGQTPNDKALIRNGDFVALDDFAEDIARLTEDSAQVLFKTHPRASTLSPDMTAFLTDRGVRFTEQNLYALLSETGLEAVHSISSSASYEATYFGKRSAYFLAPQYDIAGDDEHDFRPGRYVAVADGVLDADFWRHVLSPILPTSAPDGVSLPRKPNRLRVSLREFWGYQDVESDLLTSMYLESHFADYLERYRDRISPENVDRHLQAPAPNHPRQSIWRGIIRAFRP